jgi:hypothetical protein
VTSRAVATSADCADALLRAISRQLKIDLSLGAVTQANKERTSLSGRSLSSSLSSLIVGRHLLLLVKAPHKGLAAAELISDVAAERGLCYGSVVLGPAAAKLLSPANVIANELQGDFWLIAWAADATAIERVDAYIADTRPEGTWRAIIVTDIGYPEALRGLPSDSRQRFAFVDLS